MFRRSRNSTLFAGTNFSLTCLILPNTTGVDTDFTVESVVTGPGTSPESSRVSISQPTSVGSGVYETVVMFRRLVEADSGSYNCSALISSSQANFVTSNSTSGSETIDVGRKKFSFCLHKLYLSTLASVHTGISYCVLSLCSSVIIRINIVFQSFPALQPPNVTVTPVQVWTADGSYTLTCSATVEVFLQATPTLTWTIPGNTDDTHIVDQSNTEDMSSISINFNPLRTSHGGVYVCEATVNVSGITPQSQSANETVHVQSKFIMKCMWISHDQ